MYCILKHINRKIILPIFFKLSHCVQVKLRRLPTLVHLQAYYNLNYHTSE